MPDDRSTIVDVNVRFEELLNWTCKFVLCQLIVGAVLAIIAGLCWAFLAAIL